MASSPDEPDKKRQEPPAIEFLRPGEEQAPPSQAQGPVAWVPQPEEFQRRYAPPPPPQGPRPAGRRAVWAGLFLVLSGILGFVGMLEIYMIRPTLQDYYTIANWTSVELATNGILQIALAWPQVFGVLGGVMAFERKNFRLATVCAMLSVGNIASPFFLGSLMGIVGLLLLATARQEFAS